MRKGDKESQHNCNNLCRLQKKLPSQLGHSNESLQEHRVGLPSASPGTGIFLQPSREGGTGLLLY